MQKSSRLHYIVNSKAFAQQKNLELIIKNNDVWQTSVAQLIRGQPSLPGVCSQK